MSCLLCCAGALQEDRTVAVLFFELEVRDRLACILDFFLKYLTGGSLSHDILVPHMQAFSC